MAPASAPGRAAGGAPLCGCCLVVLAIPLAAVALFVGQFRQAWLEPLWEEALEEDEGIAELRASVAALAVGPELNSTQATVLAVMPCGRLGNILFQLGAILAVAAESPGKFKVAIPDLRRLGDVKVVLHNYETRTMQRVFATVFHKLRPLLVPPDRYLDEWPQWRAYSRCKRCNLGELLWRDRRCLAHGVRTCQVDVEGLAKYGTCLDHVSDIEDASSLSSELSKEISRAARGALGSGPQQEAPGTAGGCDVLWVTGYFQDHRYFSHHLPWLRRLFWHEPTAREAERELRKLAREDATLVSLHYRLGEFKSLGRTLTDAFYDAALREAHKRIGRQLTCVVFSDEVEEALEKAAGLELCSQAVAVPESLPDTTRFHMMALVPHHVLSASTFVYWAALVGPPKALVIAPALEHPWFRFIGEAPVGENWVAVPANFTGFKG